MWDRLFARKGEFVELGISGSPLGAILERFRDEFDLDIRIHHRGWVGRRGQRPALYCLAGRWVDGVYEDYVAVRFKEET